MSKRALPWGWLAGGLAAGALWTARDHLLARALRLPPATHTITKDRNIAIEMPDGAQLYHDHFRPTSDTPLPTILVRTPYIRSSLVTGVGKQLIMQRFAERGYHTILQDTRGRGDSDGQFEPYVHEQSDGQRTIEWIAQQPWSDGNVGMFGQSYVGYVQWAAAASQTPHLKALVPIITGSRLGRLPEHAYSLDLVLRWLLLLEAGEDPDLGPIERLGRSLVASYQDKVLDVGFNHLPLLEIDQAVFGRGNAVFQHWVERLDDPTHWDTVDHRDIVATAPPAHLIGGWYDLFLDETLEDYEQQKAAVREPYLTIGPYTHLDVRNQAGIVAEALNWFDFHLKGVDRRRPQPVSLYILNKGDWHDFAEWPPIANAQPYYLSSDASLSTIAPLATQPPSVYAYDPTDPTPSMAGPLLSSNAGRCDNRPLEARDDVLTFTTSPLTAPVDVIGYVELELYVKTSAASADFFGRLCDVAPNGTSTNICDGLVRLQGDFGEPQPDGTTRIVIPLSATACRFQTGHRIRLQVSSGAHPRFSRNTGSDESIWSATTCVTAEQQIFHDQTHPSRVILPVVTL